MRGRHLVLAWLVVAGTAAGTLPASAFWYYGPRFYGPPIYYYPPPPFYYRPPVAFVPPPYDPPPFAYPAPRRHLVMRRVIRPWHSPVPVISPFAGPGREEGITPASITPTPPPPAPPPAAPPPRAAAPNHDVYPPESFTGD